MMSLKMSNDAIIARLRGLPAKPGTPETDMDARNPNVALESNMHPSTFEYLNPTEQQKERMQMTRDATKAYYKILEAALPEGPDKTYVFRELRSLAMWCNVAITRHPDGAPRQNPS